jgi:hypothetical protein
MAMVGVITAGAVAAPKRTKVDCAAVSRRRGGLLQGGRHGDDHRGRRRSEDDLEAYYQPIYEKRGCKPFRCEASSKKTSCECRSGGTSGSVETEELNEVSSLTFR